MPTAAIAVTCVVVQTNRGILATNREQGAVASKGQYFRGELS